MLAGSGWHHRNTIHCSPSVLEWQLTRANGGSPCQKLKREIRRKRNRRRTRISLNPMCRRTRRHKARASRPLIHSRERPEAKASLHRRASYQSGEPPERSVGSDDRHRAAAVHQLAWRHGGRMAACGACAATADAGNCGPPQRAVLTLCATCRSQSTFRSAKCIGLAPGVGSYVGGLYSF
jgi:hypothetical protein